MQIERLKVESLRNLNLVDIAPSKKFNFIFGSNGSGKSSLLEAIHYLGYGRSFRTNSHSSVISDGKSSFTVFASLTNNDKEQLLGLERKKNGLHHQVRW